MLAAVGRFVIRRRKATLAAAFLFLVAAAVGGNGVADHLSSGGFVSPDSESVRVNAVLGEEFHAGTPNLVLLVTEPRGVDTPEVARAGEALTRRLAAEPGIVDAGSYWTLGRPASLRSTGGDRAVVLARIDGDEDAVKRRMADLRPRYRGTVEGLHVRVGGLAEANDEIFDRSQRDLVRSEAVIFPVTLLALLLVFGGVVAALLPLAVGAFAVVGTTLLLRLIASVTEVSLFALNLTTALGLGLAVDYSLFIVSRYREELARGAGVDDAVVTSVRTAGRTVVFSAVTVACALSGLAVFPLPFLRSIAYAGIGTTLLAGAAAVVVLPALLHVIGPRIDRLRVLRGRRGADPSRRPVLYRLATFVMRRPVPVGGLAVALLLLLAAPFLGIRFSLPDERMLPADANAPQVGRILRTEFPSRDSQTLQVLATVPGDPEEHRDEIADYARRLSTFPSVSRVDSLAGSFAAGRQVAGATPLSRRYAAPGATFVDVVPSVEPYSDASRQLVHRLRTSDAPFPVRVGGESATFVDSIDGLVRGLPGALAVIAVSTLVLLFLMTGSVLMPVIAVVVSLLSLTATFGSLVWVFQEGHLQWFVGTFTVTGDIPYSIPVLLFCVAFGLSMDYGVFLLSRIKEEYDRSGDNRESIALGLTRSGRIITAAAVLIAIVFLSFLLSGVTYLKTLGLGLSLAVVMDATLVRVVLVPAFMRLAGRWNWWSPRPLRLLHDRLGLREAEVPAVAAEDGAGATEVTTRTT
jgi:putative drug exporter of the RND superfamily